MADGLSAPEASRARARLKTDGLIAMLPLLGTRAGRAWCTTSDMTTLTRLWDDARVLLTGHATESGCWQAYVRVRGEPLMNLVRVAGGWALETGCRISRELLADAFELVGRTDDTLQAKTNPFELPTFGVEDLAAAEETSSQRLDRARIPVAGRMHPARGAPPVLRDAQ